MGQTEPSPPRLRPAVLIIRKDLDMEEEEHVRRLRMLGARSHPLVPTGPHMHPPQLTKPSS